MDVSIFDSPAVPLLVTLESEGFRMRLAADNRLQVEPGSRLTPVQRRLLVEHKPTVVMLLRCCDEGVADRREVFRAQLDATPPPTIPAFLYRSDVPYVEGRCFSCGDQTGRPSFGRCWRCSLAWRLACRLAISADLAIVIDGARQVA